MFAGFGTAEETNARFKYLLDHGETGLSIAFDLATLNGIDTDDPQAYGEFGKCGVGVSSLEDMEILLDGIPLDQVTTSMTINAPAAIIWAMYIAAAEKQGIPSERAARHHPERYPEGVHRPEGIHLPARALHAPGGGYHRVRGQGDAAVEHHLDQRLPHPRGRLHRRAGAGLHPGGRPRIRPLGHGPRHGRGRFRAAPVLLLQCPQRLLRGDRQVPRRPPHLGA